LLDVCRSWIQTCLSFAVLHRFFDSVAPSSVLSRILVSEMYEWYHLYIHRSDACSHRASCCETLPCLCALLGCLPSRVFAHLVPLPKSARASCEYAPPRYTPVADQLIDLAPDGMSALSAKGAFRAQNDPLKNRREAIPALLCLPRGVPIQTQYNLRTIS
jgi:hypothetical protein